MHDICLVLAIRPASRCWADATSYGELQTQSCLPIPLRQHVDGCYHCCCMACQLLNPYSKLRWLPIVCSHRCACIAHIPLSHSYHVCMACLPVFDAARCPALFLAKDAVLSTFSVAKQTSIVVDSGYSCTTGKRQGNQHAGFQAFTSCLESTNQAG